MFSLKTVFTTVLLAASSVLAAPINGPNELIVLSPPITSPKQADAWPMGSHQVVTWNTSSIPSSHANMTGLLLLGYLEDGSEHLDIDNPLASSFPIGAGHVNVVMPKNVEVRDNYILVLFGDSGNKSPTFRIQ
ncbi:hypothetical protein D9619_007407 [Psilocybe cf. subviscida]|uniref:Uncharacterized protein n=1 Tax=Psilocybe cf. subviscida TaxID=2480587 RepID=A0A8H5B1K4_9AGAR|nr:hypothetical protein D9619_007407 [Psilocybe cf. subviscida]